MSHESEAKLENNLIKQLVSFFGGGIDFILFSSFATDELRC